ncbi:anoctamin-6 [Erpetoichthys calabaricus]|uniref:Anoctamin n=1 Tax=Erpetoichthys calabaricus TaxID=27687 RepID=A0A8C4SLY6_ERPCA|nr:anoctamin-6 [Erpetoichthys calabaricus]
MSMNDRDDVRLDVEMEEVEKLSGIYNDKDLVEQEFYPTYGAFNDGSDMPKPEWVEVNQQSDSVFFNDGKRRIDFVLAYEDEDMKEYEKRYHFQRKKMKREHYEASLIKMGLELEAARSVVEEKLVFVKVHTPWDVLCTYAEVMHLQMPIQINDLKSRTSTFNCFTKIFSPSEDIIHPETEYFTAPFEKDRINHFLIEDQETFFNPSTRSRIANYILSRANYEMTDKVRKFGINKLLDTGVYKAAFPLHDCRFNVKSEDLKCPNERYLLYREWAHPRSFYKLQPLDLIRKYYGEKVGIYFAWLGFYTKMLVVAAFFGLCCFIYGYKTRDTNTWSIEVCDPEVGGRIIMCPQCDRECTYWKLNSTCESTKKLSIFDHYGTLVFAVLMSIWVTIFLEFWKRHQAELNYEWDTAEFLEQEELPRPEYEAKCKYEKINPVTKEKELVPHRTCEKCLRVSCGVGTVLFWIVLIVASVVGIIVYRLSVFFVFAAKMQHDLKELEPLKEYLTPQMATSVTASIISFIIIMILNMVYEKVAIMITDFELPRTQTDYENSLTLKMFLFQFVNYYSSCFYIAFFKGKIVGYPKSPVYWLGKYRNEECDPSGCLVELTTQLTIVMGGKAIWNNIQEVLLPWIKNIIGRYKAGKPAERQIPRWEQDYELQSLGKLGLFYEYLEMVIQFGFVTLFVASFPLAPLLALLNNLFEIRVDAWKLTTQYRRVVPEKAQDIGAWQPILQGIAILAVVTNAMIIAFTSDMIPRLVYYWSLSVEPYTDQYSPTNPDNMNNTMKGYINSTLSVFNISDFSDRSKPNKLPMWFNNETDTTCRYRDFRYPPGHPHEYMLSIYYWHVIAAKLAFIIVVEHIVYFTKFLLEYLIPDVPATVKEQIKRESYLTQKKLHETNLKLVRKRVGSMANKLIKDNEIPFELITPK